MTEQQPRASLGCACRCSRSCLCANRLLEVPAIRRSDWCRGYLGFFPLYFSKQMCFGVVGKVEMGSRIKKKHPNRGRSCLRQMDVPWFVAQTPLMMPQGWVCPCRGDPHSSITLLPAARCSFGWRCSTVPHPHARQQGGGTAPGHPPPVRSPFPTPGIQDWAALPAPSPWRHLLLSRWQQAGQLILININTALATLSPPFQQRTSPSASIRPVPTKGLRINRRNTGTARLPPFIPSSLLFIC